MHSTLKSAAAAKVIKTVRMIFIDVFIAQLQADVDVRQAGRDLAIGIVQRMESAGNTNVPTRSPAAAGCASNPSLDKAAWIS